MRTIFHFSLFSYNCFTPCSLLCWNKTCTWQKMIGSANWYRAVYWKSCLTLQCLREFLADIFLALNQSIREGMKSDPEITRTGWNFPSSSSLSHAMSLGNSACLIKTFAVHYAPKNKSSSKTAWTAGMGCSFLNYSCLLKWDYFAEWSQRMCSPPGMFSLWAHCLWKRNSLLCWEGMYCTCTNEKQQLQKVYYAGL